MSKTTRIQEFYLYHNEMTPKFRVHDVDLSYNKLASIRHELIEFRWRSLGDIHMQYSFVHKRKCP